MNLSFGKQLFRLLLLFAILPSLLLIITGYYLSTENILINTNETDDNFLELSDYYNNRNSEYLEDEINRYVEDNDYYPLIADFMYINSGVFTGIHKGVQILSEQLINSLLKHKNDTNNLILIIDDTIYQYNVKVLDTNNIIYAGFKFDQTYSELMQSYQDKRAELISVKYLNKKYLLFVGIIFITLAIITIIFAYYFSSKISKNMSKPLAKLALAANAISEGNFNQQVKLSGSSEMISLISNFNEMANKLEQTTAKLTQSERVAAWRHIARRFAHELKNPLQPILISLYQIENKLIGTTDQNEIKDKLKLVSDEIKHLTDLADRFSMLAKLPEPKLNTIDLRKVMNSLTELYHDLLKPFSFHLQLPDYEIPVSIDLTYFREAIHNLFKNAIEASTHGDVIMFSLKKENKMAIITLEDHGEGMSNEVIASARLPYYTTRQSGSGIGLAIVEKTINEINGQLEINSEPNKGTIITIRLPLANREQNA